MMKIPLMRMRVVIQELYTNNIVVIIIVVVVDVVLIVTVRPRVDVGCSAWISFIHHHRPFSRLLFRRNFRQKLLKHHLAKRLFHAHTLLYNMAYHVYAIYNI